MTNKLLIIMVFCISTSCNTFNSSNETLKIYGERKLAENGKDSVYFTIPSFSFLNQDSVEVNNSTFNDKIYVADFFFTSCPTICPRMKAQMIRVYNEFKTNKSVAILSHTIDPEHDTPDVLKEFAKNIGVESGNWHFVTGNKDTIYTLAKQYMVMANEDQNAPGGFVHSGAFILIDKKGRIRGYYDGTDPLKVDLLISDIRKLLESE